MSKDVLADGLDYPTRWLEEGEAVSAEWPSVTAHRTITKLMHSAGDAPCQKIAQHASPDFLTSMHAGEITVPCLGCNRMVGKDDVSDGETYVEGL